MTEIISPYEASGSWYRGNLHSHTTESDGERPVEQVVADYEARGYDFLAISDHDVFVDPEEYRDQSALTLIPAVEISANGSHLQHIGASTAIEPVDDRQVIVDEIEQQGGIAVGNHPKWEADFDHWSVQQLGALSGIDGIEIYNGLIESHPGSACATDHWDQLLTANNRIWGFANDDSHRSYETARAWNVVQAEGPSSDRILDALRSGRFYASTGVTIEDIRVADTSITIETSKAERIRFVTDHGVVQRSVSDAVATIRLPAHLVYGSDHSYVRVECIGQGGTMAWTQPFFLD